MAAISKFERNSSTYKCGSCNKLTRDTGYGERGCDLCKRCYVEGGLENEHADYGHPTVRFEEGIICPDCAGE